MVNDLKYFDGSVQPIERVPDDLKRAVCHGLRTGP
jgi:ribonucleoside-diphosphate reductase alpha chain